MTEEPSAAPKTRAVGIDLGTTLSSVAQVNDAGEAAILANAEGELRTASVVFFADEMVLVGRDAVREAMSNPQRAVFNVKRAMGDPQFTFSVDGDSYTPEAISSLVLRKVTQDASRQIGLIERAVITVPAYFDDARRKATEDAGTIAGLEVIDIINEPTAAALAYGFSGKSEDGVFMVYDLGGGTFDVTVIEKQGSDLITLATDGDVQLGGKDWDERLVNELARRFREEFKEDPREDHASLAYLTLTAEESKKALSRRRSTRVPVSYKGHWGNYEVTREEFESLTADLLAMTQLTTELVIEEAGVTWAGIKCVVPTGGSTRMPAVMQMLERMSGKPIEIPIPVDDAVAMGAALHAAIMELHSEDRLTEFTAEAAERLGRIQTTDVAAHALGLVIKDHQTLQYRNDILIKKNSRLPASVTKTYQTAHDGQTTIVLRVVQGDAPDPEACITLDAFNVTGLPEGRPAGAPVKVTFSYDTKGRVHVTAEDIQTGQKMTTEISRTGGMEADHISAEAQRLSLKSVE
ncbi:MAG: Hsp70 family protein [Anaerolineaceae bacterium]|nr:Hsp70 family protein [Anaerolineaceae bacterium]